MQNLLPIQLLVFILYINFATAQNCDLPILEKEIIQKINTGAFEEGQKAMGQWPACANSIFEKYKGEIYRYQLYRNERRYKHAYQAAQSADSIWQILDTPLPASLSNHWLIMAEAAALRERQKEAKGYITKYQTVEHTAVPADAAYAAFIKAFMAQHGSSDYGQAQQLYQKALNLFLALPEPPIYHTGQTLRYLASTLRVDGDYDQALYFYEQELALYAATYPPDHKEVANTHYNLGAALYELLRYEEALNHFLQTHQVWSAYRQPEDKYMRYLNEAIGDMYWELGNRGKALEYYDLSTAGELPINNDRAYPLLDQGEAFLSAGREELAMQRFQQALDWRLDMYGKQHAMTGACQNFIGKKLYEAGRFDDAVWAYQQTIRMLVPGMTDTASLANPDLSLPVISEHDLLEALASKGIALAKRQQLSTDNSDQLLAYETLQLAIHWMERIRQRPVSAAAKAFWSGKHQQVFEAMIGTALYLYRKNGEERYLHAAFEASEKSKAFLLLSALQSQKATSFTGVPDSVVQREQALQRAILEYEGKIGLEAQRCGEAREKQLGLWQQKQLSLKSEYDGLLKTIEQTYPAYHALKYEVEPVSVAAVQEQLLSDGRSALATYFEGNESIYVFFITQKGLQVFDCQKDENYEKQLGQLLQNISSPEYFLQDPAQAFRDFTQDAFALYQFLLEKPLAQCPTTVSHLYIVPDGQIYFLPFECLLTQPSDVEKRNYAQLPYLLKSYSASYSQSATLLCQQVNKRKPKQHYIAFAPDYSLVQYDDQPLFLNALFANQQEARAGASLFGGKAFTALAASEAAFKKSAPAAAILHLALHTIPNHQDPMLSRLLFSPGDGEDGILHGFELYNLRLSADLAVLSACHTGSGQLQSGEGMMSLERGFQYAGCTSLLTTLWTVDDAATSSIALSFLGNIKQGKLKDEALAAAQLGYLSSADPAMGHPFYWAGFRMVGQVEALRADGFSWWWVLLVAVLGFGSWWVWNRKPL